MKNSGAESYEGMFGTEYRLPALSGMDGGGAGGKRLSLASLGTKYDVLKIERSNVDAWHYSS